jgi:opacity protein-like surface antigen
MKQEKWAERLEKHLEGYRKSPSRDLWEGIEASLDKEEKARFVPFFSSKRTWLVAATLIGAIFAGTYLLWEKEVPTDVTASVIEKQPKSEGEPKEESPEEKIVETMTIGQEKHLSQGTILSAKDSSVVAEVINNQSVSETEEQTNNEEPQPQGSAPNIQFPEQKRVIEADPRIQKKTDRQRSQIEVNLYASAGSGSWNGSNGVLMSPTLQQQFAATRGEKTYLVGYEERQSHNQPVSFGLTLSYPITNRLSVSTGVVYSKLTSDFITLMPDNQIHRYQALHYVGVPLSLHFRIWQWRGFSTYLSAGGQAEWNVKAEANTDGVDQEMKKDRMQWSIGGSLGLQYNLLPQIGLYAEPGIRHYFDNGSSISNFYKDKPTSFNLQLGLRFNF